MYILQQFKIRTPLILAPMAGLSHSALRLLIEDYGGADLYFSEMISCSGIKAHSPFISSYLSLLPRGEKVVYQLLGNSAEDFETACRELEPAECGGLDINMGCGAPDIRKRGGGIRWMEDRERAAALIARLRPLVRGKTLSAKIRLGEKEDPAALASFARGLEEEGLDFITLHPRTRKEKFSRSSRWSYVALLKEELNIPVVGNGDIRTPGDLARVRENYAPDGVMIGRGAARKPWIFRHLREKEKDPGHETVVDLEQCWRNFFIYLKEQLPGEFHPSRSRRFFWYATENLPFGHQLNMKIQNTRTADEVEEIVFTYLAEYPGYARYVDRS